MPEVDGIAGHNLTCPACGELAGWHADTVTTDEFVESEAGWACEECGWEQEATPEDEERRIEWNKNLQPVVDACWDAIRNHKSEPNTTTVADHFEYAPEGDFKWDAEEAGDWNVYCCGEKDCPVQWHRIAYACNMGRENGKRWIEIREVDSDGDRDFSASWDEREEGCDTPECWDEVMDYPNSDEHFLGWARYWLDAAETHKDPCDQIIGRWQDKAESWEHFCVSAAADMVRYLNMGK